MKHRINDTFDECDGITGFRTDRPHQLVAVHLALLEKPQDQQLGHAVHEIGVAHFNTSNYEVFIPCAERYRSSSGIAPSRSLGCRAPNAPEFPHSIDIP